MQSKINSIVIRTFLLDFNKCTVKDYIFVLYGKAVLVYFHSEHLRTNTQIPQIHSLIPRIFI